jgi:hypothetical protein
MEPYADSDSNALNPYTSIISLFSAPYNRLPKLSLQKVYFRIQMIFFYDLCLITML